MQCSEPEWAAVMPMWMVSHSNRFKMVARKEEAQTCYTKVMSWTCVNVFLLIGYCMSVSILRTMKQLPMATSMDLYFSLWLFYFLCYSLISFNLFVTRHFRLKYTLISNYGSKLNDHLYFAFNALMPFCFLSCRYLCKRIVTCFVQRRNSSQFRLIIFDWFFLAVGNQLLGAFKPAW